MFEEYAQEVSTPTDDDMNALYEEYERREWPVVCKHCGLKATATQKALDAAGWSLTRTGEICQSCIDFDAGIAIGRAQHLIEQIEGDKFDVWKADRDADEVFAMSLPTNQTFEDCPF